MKNDHCNKNFGGRKNHWSHDSLISSGLLGPDVDLVVSALFRALYFFQKLLLLLFCQNWPFASLKQSFVGSFDIIRNNNTTYAENMWFRLLGYKINFYVGPIFWPKLRSFDLYKGQGQVTKVKIKLVRSRSSYKGQGQVPRSHCINLWLKWKTKDGLNKTEAPPPPPSLPKTHQYVHKTLKSP